MSTAKECSICASTFSSKLRKPIECTFCNKCCCKECFSMFTKGQSVPKCMFCNTELTMDFVEENTTMKFMKEYNSYLCGLKFSVERSKLPATQRLAEIIRIKDKIMSDRCSKWLEIKKVHDELKRIRLYCRQLSLTPEEKKQKKIEKNEKKKKYIDLLGELRVIDNNNFITGVEEIQQRNILTGVVPPPTEDVIVDEEKSYSRPCLATDCRGFLSKSYKCGTCEKYFCAECHETKNSRVDETHVCNEDAKATIAMIAKDSKPCPKCMIPIEKVSGCSQMWCVNCHTTFDWNTMKIDTGYIHNPEYLRWMRENNKDIPRNPYDVVGGGAGCNAMPYWHQIDNILRPLNIRSPEWDEIHRRTHHVQAMMQYIPRGQREMDFVDMRLDYLLSRISEEDWKKKLKMLIKKNKIGQERYNVCDLYYNAMKDLFINLVENKDFVQFKHSAYELEKYTNQQFEKINKKYGSKDKKFSEIKNM